MEKNLNNSSSWILLCVIELMLYLCGQNTLTVKCLYRILQLYRDILTATYLCHFEIFKEVFALTKYSNDWCLCQLLPSSVLGCTCEISHEWGWDLIKSLKSEYKSAYLLISNIKNIWGSLQAHEMKPVNVFSLPNKRRFSAVSYWK